MGNSIEKIYDIMYKDNDRYTRIYGDPSPSKRAADSKGKPPSSSPLPPKEEKKK